MFYQNQPKDSQNKYITLLRSIGSLSELFSDSDSPYLYYRAAERIFCRSFSAIDLSREDSSFDAKYQKLGIGLKTFLYKNGSCIEKIAEFNSKSDTLRSLLSNKHALINKVAELRNTRIQFTKDAHKLDDSIYHCISRDKGKFLVYECPLIPINLERLNVNEATINKNSIVFNDDTYEYRFNLSKSTLYKRFDIKNSFLEEIDIPIIADPFTLLEGLLPAYYEATKKEQEYPSIMLPLYSAQSGQVEQRSGLNQWKAKGRPRHPDEIYIPIPAWVNNNFSNFFPAHNISFNISLPNGEIISAKRCQSGSKGLMSNPNKVLGKWILRDLLKIPEGVLCTKKMLEDIGIDTILLEKIDNDNYKMSFLPVGSFDDFQAVYKK